MQLQRPVCYPEFFFRFSEMEANLEIETSHRVRRYRAPLPRASITPTIGKT